VRAERTFVIDADIARSARAQPRNRDKWPDAARAALDVLHALRSKSEYGAVFDGRLWREWDKHAGHAARRWRADMDSRNRLLLLQGPVNTSWIEEQIRCQLPADVQPIARKDAHLVALAAPKDRRRILSNDGRAREKFARINDTRINRIHWVKAGEESVRWLRQGAEERPEWWLRPPGQE